MNKPDIINEAPRLMQPAGSKQECDYIIETALWLFKLANHTGSRGLSDMAAYAEFIKGRVE